MKYMYQQIIAVFIIFITSTSVLSYNYTFYNKTDVDLEISYIPVNFFTSDVLRSPISAGSIKPNDVTFLSLKDSLCLRTIFVTDPSGKYAKLEDKSIIGRCYNKAWDVVVKKKWGHIFLDLVDHSSKNSDTVKIGKPTRIVGVGND